MVVNTQIGELHGAISGNIRDAAVDNPETANGDVHPILRVLRLANDLVLNTIHNDVIRRKFGIFLKHQIGINLDNLFAIGSLNFQTAACRIDDQRIRNTGANGTCTLGFQDDIAAVRLDVLLSLVGIAVHKTCHGRNQGNGDILFRPNQTNGIVCLCGRILGDSDFRLGIIRSDNDTIGLDHHVSSRHTVAEVTVVVVADG